MKNLFLLFSIIFIGLSSCVDREFDAPPDFTPSDPSGISADQILTIEELKGLAVGEFTEIGLESMYIRGTIVADDQSGNFYKSLVIQDETGGITILLDAVELWNRLPVGRRVFIHLQDIWLGEFNGLPQIGFEPYIDDQGRRSMARIPAVLIPDIVLRGERPGAPEARVRLINSLSDADLNTLVTLSDVEFDSGSTGQPYGDSAGGRSVNHILNDCNGYSMVVRSSGFATFADELTAGGNGSITGIYGVFGEDRQIIIRDLTDVAFTGTRCDGTGSGPIEIDPTKVVTVKSILDMRVDGTETNIGSDTYLQGVVVSSDETGNFFKTIVVQDETGGVAILANKFDTFLNYPIGTEVYVSLKDLFISDYEGLPQLGYAPSTENVKRIPETLLGTIILPTGNTQLVSPKAFTITELSEAQLNTFIQLSEVQFIDADQGNTYADAAQQFSLNNNLEDCDGNQIIVRSSGYSDFADEVIPSGNGTVRAILTAFQGNYQLTLNFSTNVNLLDARCDGSTGGGPGGGGGGSDDNFNIDFENFADFDLIEIEGWLNVATEGDRVWQKRSFDENGYAELKAYQDTNPKTEAWLVTPAIATAEKSTLNFRSSMAFYEHDGLEILVSTDFGGDVTSADWQTITAPLASGSNDNYEWVSSGEIDLAQYGSDIHIAFKYSGTAAANTTTYYLDDIIIK